MEQLLLEPVSGLKIGKCSRARFGHPDGRAVKSAQFSHCRPLRAASGASRSFPRFPANVPSPNDQQTLSVAARTAIACDRPARNCGERYGRGYNRR